MNKDDNEPSLTVPMLALVQQRRETQQPKKTLTFPRTRPTGQFEDRFGNKRTEREKYTRLEAPIMNAEDTTKTQEHSKTVEHRTNREERQPVHRVASEWQDADFSMRIQRIGALRAMKDIPSDMRNAAIAKELGLPVDSYKPQPDTGDMFIGTLGKATAVGLAVGGVAAVAIGMVSLATMLMPQPPIPVTVVDG